MQLAVADALIIFDGAVIEVFQRSFNDSARMPVAWSAVQVEVKRNDRRRLSFGQVADHAGPVLYGAEVGNVIGQRWLELSVDEEAQVRAFFAEVARLSGRVIQ